MLRFFKDVYLYCSNNATLSPLPGHNTLIIKVLLELISYQLCSDPIIIAALGVKVLPYWSKSSPCARCYITSACVF